MGGWSGQLPQLPGLGQLRRNWQVQWGALGCLGLSETLGKERAKQSTDLEGLFAHWMTCQLLGIKGASPV
jgi:hypothetical protein